MRWSLCSHKTRTRWSTSHWTRWHSRWCSRWSSRCCCSRRGLWIIDKLHKFLVAMRAALEGSAIFNHEPKEPSFHVLITLTNNMDLWLDNKGIGVVFAQRLRNCAKTCSKRVSARLDPNLQKYTQSQNMSGYLSEHKDSI